ncbi:MAG TPA: histidine phosphatase family protein [Microvirga sp.]|jgi:phosphohistidine phosphatase|nr:histidine phosphatase family protein [Microvirga sp.]
MRRLMLLRHAKSAWPGGSADIDRPLATRGRDAAPLVARHMADEGLAPDLVLVSPARRTQETWNLVRGSAADAQVRTDSRIYEAPPGRLLEVVQEVVPEVRTLLMIGHNPGFEGLARILVGHGDRYAFARLSQKYPTAGLAVIDFPVESWREVEPRTGRLDRFVTPKTLGADADDD